MKALGIVSTLLLLGMLSCTKTELNSTDYLDIIDEEIEIVYDLNKANSYYIIKYNATEMSRVFWTSTDSFITILFNDTIKTAVINYSTYTKDNSTGKQIVYFDKSHIGDTLNIYASSGMLKDSLRIIIK